jgi:hypothetical protein
MLDMTKKRFCKMQIQDYLLDNELTEIDDSAVYQSSTIAVCMEYLGLIEDEEAKEYATCRGGNLFSYYDKDEKDVAILSVRELIELLPEN